MATVTRPSPAEVWDWLSHVPDPEIPVISLTDLGIIRDVAWDDDTLVVTVTPTYSGCPATAVINLDIEGALRDRGVGKLRLARQLAPAWTTDWISAEGREKLRAAGFAPPAPREAAPPTLLQLQRAPLRCPYCGSTDTKLENLFGPTPCRSLRYCSSCRQPFEQFKTI